MSDSRRAGSIPGYFPVSRFGSRFQALRIPGSDSWFSVPSVWCIRCCEDVPRLYRVFYRVFSREAGNSGSCCCAPWSRWSCVSLRPCISCCRSALYRSRSAAALVLASDGSVLLGFLTAGAKWRCRSSPRLSTPLYRRMPIAAEDRRFDRHPGVDPVAVVLALVQRQRLGEMAEAAMLVAGPRSPERLRPDRTPRRLAPPATASSRGGPKPA